MKLKELVLLSLFTGVGFVFHSVIPGIFFGMKPDMMLVMMFLGILLFPKMEHTILLGILTGILCAMTTNFPLGQLPNIIDKIITAILFLGFVTIGAKIRLKLIYVLCITLIGTIISGSVFLISALLLVGLPAPFTALFITIVLSASGINTFVMALIYPVFQKIQKQFL